MKKQTAVEYLVEQLFPKALSEEQYYHIEKAKAMEKEQIIYAHMTGLIFEIEGQPYQQCEKHYNETYNTDTL
jgi:hypothetical protein